MRLPAFITITFLAALCVSSCLSDSQIEFKRYYSSGAIVYQTHCQNCHGINGEGLSALIPPLTDSVFLRSNLHHLSCYVKNGLHEPLNVGGKAYQGQMPGKDLSAIEIARVLTFVGNSFGNKLNTIPIEQTQEDLKACN